MQGRSQKPVPILPAAAGATTVTGTAGTTASAGSVQLQLAPRHSLAPRLETRSLKKVLPSGHPGMPSRLTLRGPPSSAGGTGTGTGTALSFTVRQI